MCADLVEAANKFIQCNFKKVSETDDFLGLTKDDMLDIISRDELNVCSEEEVLWVLGELMDGWMGDCWGWVGVWLAG